MNHDAMQASDYLDFLVHDIHSTILSTVDESGKPKSRAIDMMLAKKDRLYFLTANKKAFYRQLLAKPFVSITGMKGKDSMSTVAITVNGEVRSVGTQFLAEILQNNPYMTTLYPDQQSQSVLRVFEVFKGSVSVFDLSTKPIYQASYVIQ